ncbi:MAG: sigma-70 family RNA polymerase sigma factor [Planctomycetota bacterium]
MRRLYTCRYEPATTGDPVTSVLARRSNDEWLTALRSHDGTGAPAIRELEQYLESTLARVLSKHGGSSLELHDIVQETLLKLVADLETFRGDSAFPTWATAVAIRVAFTELRRRRVREKGKQDFDLVQQVVADGRAATDTAEDESSGVVVALQHAIDAELTERQKVAILAELRGIPTIEIAERMGTNQNALYKLVHDARKKLRGALTKQGFTAACIRGAADEDGVSA